MPFWKQVSPDWLICSVLREISILRVNTRLDEPFRWTFIAASQGASLQMWITDLRSARNKKRNTCVGKEGYEWRDNHTTHLFGSPFLWYDERTNKQTNVFTGQFWQWPTRTLIASKSMDEQASQHTFKKLILSVWFVFGSFNGCWNDMLYFTLEGRKDCHFPPLWVVLSPCTCFLFFILVLSPNLLRKAVKVEGTREGIVGDQARLRAAWC